MYVHLRPLKECGSTFLVKKIPDGSVVKVNISGT